MCVCVCVIYIYIYIYIYITETLMFTCYFKSKKSMYIIAYLESSVQKKPFEIVTDA